MRTWTRRFSDRRIQIALGVAPLVLAGSLSAAPAAANGKFPAAGQIIVDPGDPTHIVVRATFGILVSRDSGANFDWICESGAGYGGGNDPGIAVTGDGTIIGGLIEGLDVGHGDACAWSYAGGGLAGVVVNDVSIVRSQPSTAVAMSIGLQGNIVWESPDNGVTWAQAGVHVPSDFQGLTIDVASSDPQRIYVGGVHSHDGGFSGGIARSGDGGATWELVDIPAAGGATPYLAAVDPTNADVLYARLDAAPGSILASQDGGWTWTSVLTIPGYVMAFALSPDGATILAGGPGDGLYRASRSDLAFQKVSQVAATCLAWSGEDVYACGTSHFAVARSTDQGATFTTLLTLPCIRGPLACDPATPVGMQCPGQWPLIGMSIGTAFCGVDGGPDAASDGSIDTDASPSDSGGAGSGGGSRGASGGCGCRAAAEGSGAGAALGLVLASSVLGARRRSRSRWARRASR